ncbi:hypothetical protein [Mycolicibacterium iranicum]|uniref:Recombinase zinc beta ribbon domain-containing protein n=1 Tax=Mycolicibacterium iranicum TaxID=912594 RepID=A0ABT4HNQ7_MYCIR|nr:hypothetical protein [Mycolicibacterium iranicum]MCZ0731862.1 hypothetical protein [Mycolicibacterium iranicum]
MEREPKRRREIAPGTLALICDDCHGIVTRGGKHANGYLTCQRGRWLIFHDCCRAPGNELAIRESRISSYPLLLTTLASLAAEVNGFRNTDWPTLLRRVVSDTEWYWDSGGGQMTIAQMVAENRDLAQQAGLTQKLTEDRRA